MLLGDTQLRKTYTDKKENQIVLKYKEIQKGSVAKTNGLLIHGYILCISSLGSHSSYMTLQPFHLNFLIYEENFVLFFISVEYAYIFHPSHNPLCVMSTIEIGVLFSQNIQISSLSTDLCKTIFLVRFVREFVCGSITQLSKKTLSGIAHVHTEIQ